MCAARLGLSSAQAAATSKPCIHRTAFPHELLCSCRLVRHANLSGVDRAVCEAAALQGKVDISSGLAAVPAPSGRRCGRWWRRVGQLRAPVVKWWRGGIHLPCWHSRGYKAPDCWGMLPTFATVPWILTCRKCTSSTSHGLQVLIFPELLDETAVTMKERPYNKKHPIMGSLRGDGCLGRPPDATHRALWLCLCLLRRAQRQPDVQAVLRSHCRLQMLLLWLTLVRVSTLLLTCAFQQGSRPCRRSVSIQDVCAAACGASPHMFARLYRLDVTAPTLAQSVDSGGSSQNRAPSLLSPTGDSCLLYGHVWKPGNQYFSQSETWNECYEGELKGVDINPVFQLASVSVSPDHPPHYGSEEELNLIGLNEFHVYSRDVQLWPFPLAGVSCCSLTVAKTSLYCLQGHSRWL